MVVVLPTPGGPTNTSQRSYSSSPPESGWSSADNARRSTDSEPARHSASVSRQATASASGQSMPTATSRATTPARMLSSRPCRLAVRSGRATDISGLPGASSATRSAAAVSRTIRCPIHPRQPGAGTSSVDSTSASGPSSLRTAARASRTVRRNTRFTCMSIQGGDRHHADLRRHLGVREHDEVRESPREQAPEVWPQHRRTQEHRLCQVFIRQHFAQPRRQRLRAGRVEGEDRPAIGSCHRGHQGVLERPVPGR